jgi:hypothetical protein
MRKEEKSIRDRETNLRAALKKKFEVRRRRAS